MVTSLEQSKVVTLLTAPALIIIPLMVLLDVIALIPPDIVKVVIPLDELLLELLLLDELLELELLELELLLELLEELLDELLEELLDELLLLWLLLLLELELLKGDETVP